MDKQRQRQIEIAALDYYNSGSSGYSIECNFTHGAEWADINQISPWHNLTENPDDLPKANKEVLVKYISYVGNNECNDTATYVFNQDEQCYEWRFRILGSYQEILAWMEMPEFKK